MRPEHIEQQKNITSKQESKTGCMCPAVIEDGYINWYCGKELKTNGTSGAKCNRDGKYRCVVPSIEAIHEVDCETLGKVCKPRACAPNDKECTRKRDCGRN